MQETWILSLSGEDPLEKEVAAQSSILVRESQGQRSLAGYSPWGHERVGRNLVNKQQREANLEFFRSRVVFLKTAF